jgi:hypothetical protein
VAGWTRRLLLAALWVIVPLLAVSMVPPAAVGAAGGGTVETDPSTLPWSTLTRWLLEAGVFPPVYRPVSRAELARLLAAAAEGEGSGGSTLPALERAALRQAARRLGPPYGAEGSSPGGTYRGWSSGLQLLVSGDQVGDLWRGRGGLLMPAGLSMAASEEITFWSGRWWASLAPRLTGRIAAPADPPPSALAYPGWPLATGRPVTGRSRRDEGAWRLSWPRLVGGAGFGPWAFSLGVMSAQLGPGRTGALTRDPSGEPFPVLSVRRTARFTWRGWFSRVAPSDLLLQVGRVSLQEVAYEDVDGPVRRQEHPWYFQWLLGWHTRPWLRLTMTGAALAAARRGTLWPDLVQVNFPMLGATWAETQRGPLTDRIFSVQMEARYRRAPWPLLPATAGRLYWEYAGEDFRPGRIPFLPQLSAPASVAGWQMLDPRWDLSLEYVELEHPQVLWYAHSNFQSGWTHRRWLIGHPLGGGARAWNALVRWRPLGPRWELSLGFEQADWHRMDRLPGEARTRQWSLAYGRPLAAARWSVEASWLSEEVQQPAAAAVEEWLRIRFALDR